MPVAVLGLLLVAWLIPLPAVPSPSQTITAPAQELPVQRIAGDRALTQIDEAEIARLIAPHGKAWLVFGPLQGQLAEYWTSQIYIQPIEAGAVIRRGKVVYLRASAAPGAVDLKNWSATVHDYAQVPNDRNGVLSRNSTDLPFVEFHRLPDADLLTLVAFVRACPCRPESGATPSSLLNTVNGARPIGSVRSGSGGDVEVYVVREHMSGWTLTLRREAGTWRLIAIRFSIA